MCESLFVQPSVDGGASSFLMLPPPAAVNIWVHMVSTAAAAAAAVMQRQDMEEGQLADKASAQGGRRNGTSSHETPNRCSNH